MHGKEAGREQRFGYCRHVALCTGREAFEKIQVFGVAAIHQPSLQGACGQPAARLGGAEKRRARGRARSAHRLLTRRSCLNAVSAANEVSSATGPRDRASQGSRCAAATAFAERRGLLARAFAAPPFHPPGSSTPRGRTAPATCLNQPLPPEQTDARSSAPAQPHPPPAPPRNPVTDRGRRSAGAAVPAGRSAGAIAPPSARLRR
jgi:hypothetical protein